jgi:hypothetical protein
LAARLTGEFGGGLSRTNLASMRQSYLTYPDRIQNCSDSVWTTLDVANRRDSVCTIAAGKRSIEATVFPELIGLVYS